MDGLHNIAGDRTTTLTVGGKTYTLTTQILRDYAEREAYILEHRDNPFALLDYVPDSRKDEAFDRAWKEAKLAKFVPLEEEKLFDSSMRGIGWRLWRALRDHHPEIDSVQAALDLIERAGNEMFGTIVDKLDGSEEKDILGNSNGRDTTRPDVPPPTIHGFPGRNFTEDSVTDTGGLGNKSTG